MTTVRFQKKRFACVSLEDELESYFKQNWFKEVELVAPITFTIPMVIAVTSRLKATQ